MSYETDEFVAAMETMKSADRFLSQTIRNHSLAQEAGRAFHDATISAGERAASLRSERPDATTVLVLGEFKAGKSTLINAFVGKTVAASDVFELTQVVCRVFPVPGSAVERVELFDGKSQYPQKTLTLGDFLTQAQNRTLSCYKLANAYVHSRMENVVLVDTPGLGATLVNEIAALDALSSADVVLCIVDGSALGGGRDAATITRMLEIDLPFVCVLTKADIFDAGELEMAIDYLEESLDVPRQNIYAVSAKRLADTGSDTGIERLQEHLQKNVAKRGRELRYRSLLAQAKDTAAQYASVVGDVCVSLESTLAELERYQNDTCESAASFTDELCDKVRDMLRERIQINLGAAQRLTQDGAAQRLTQDDFKGALREAIHQSLNQDFVNDLIAQIKNNTEAQWTEGLKAQIQFLEANLTAMQEQMNQEVTQATQVMIASEKRKQKATAQAVGSAIAGGAIVIGGLATGGVLTALLAAPFLVEAWLQKKEADEANDAMRSADELRETVSRWHDAVIHEATEKHLRPQLSRLNRRIAEGIVNNYAASLDQWALPVATLQELLGSGRAVTAELSAITRTNRLITA